MIERSNMSQTFNSQSWIDGWAITSSNFESCLGSPLPSWTELYDPANAEDAADRADAHALEVRLSSGEAQDLMPYSVYRTQRLGR